MINQKSLEAVKNSSFSKDFCKPLYDSYCFSRIPGTVKKLLTGSGVDSLPNDTVKNAEYDNVILLFVDGFGWHFLEKYQEKYPFLQHFIKEGIATKLTSQFPSTTAPHVTCINTGQAVGQSGVYEWFYYEPQVDRMIAPLLFSFAGDKESCTLKKTGIAPEALYPTRTVYEDLKEQGIASYVFQHESIAHSPYSKIMFNHANHMPYVHLSDALDNIVSLSSKEQSKAYFYLYFGDIDSVGHRSGIHSEKFDQAVDHCFRTMDEKLKKLSKNKKTACIVVADHGMVAVNPKTTLYLNAEFPEITRYLQRNKQGGFLAPAGSCRDFFLHLQEVHREEAILKLREFLKGKAEVYPIEDLIDEGFFGTSDVSQTFLDRVGNAVILPYLNEAVWWYDKGRFEQHFHGAHGGLTREEMETIFLFAEASSL
jgi:predicted AlkP superfamily pyrophosphatase or phosphodiesterase